MSLMYLCLILSSGRCMEYWFVVIASDNDFAAPGGALHCHEMLSLVVWSFVHVSIIPFGESRFI